MMRLLGRALVFVVLLFACKVASADTAACLDAASKGQKLRTSHKLVEARDALRVCAASNCPAVVQSDCALWLAEVEASIPTVVVAAKAADGADLIDVVVTMDGGSFAAKLDGQAMAVDGGPHLFHFEAKEGAVDKQVVVREGVKNQSIVGAFPPGATIAPMVPEPRKQPLIRLAGWVIGGVGVVGLGVGAAFGAVALRDKSAAHCVNDVCDPGTLSGMKAAATASDVGFIAGGVLVSVGATLVIVPSSRSKSTVGSLTLAPAVVTGGSGLVAVGTF